jgi:drug/metabolite transporter (DMT)-like permease
LYLVPAAAILISLIWLAQLPGPVELAGGAVALGGVVLASSKGRPRAQPPDGVARAEGVEARPVQKI